MSRSDARPFAGPPDEDGPAQPDRSRARSVVAVALSGLWRLLLSNFRLRSEPRREGQGATKASPFSRLALTQMLSLGADAMVTVALAGSLFFSTPVASARGRVALSLILTVAPFAVVAPFLGPIVDRAKGGRRAMIVASAVGRVVACLLMARYIHSLLLFPAAFLTLVSSKTYTVAKAAIVPAVVEHNDDLVEANSKLAVGGAVAGFLASIPGVPILKLFGAATLLRVDSVVFVLCAISALRLVQTPTPRVSRQATDTDIGATSTDGSRNNLPPGALTAAAIAMATLRFTVGFMVFLVAFAFRRTSAPAWWYGVILAASVGGNLLGAAIAPRLRGRVREEYIVAGSIAAVVAAGLLLLPFDVFQRRPASSALAAVVGIAAGAGKLAFDSLVQQEVPAASQGRMFGRLEATFQLFWVLGALVPVLIALSLADGDLFVTAVAGIALITYVVGVRQARRGLLPHWWPGTVKEPTAPPPALGGAVGIAPETSSSPPSDVRTPPGDRAPYWPEPSTPTVAAGPPTTPNLARPPRLPPPPPLVPPPFDGGTLPDPPR